MWFRTSTNYKIQMEQAKENEKNKDKIRALLNLIIMQIETQEVEDIEGWQVESCLYSASYAKEFLRKIK